MKMTAMELFFVLVLATASGDAEREGTKPAQDVEVSGTIVDGLGRPVQGATVAFSYHSGPYYELKKVPLATFTTDATGRYAGLVHNWPPSEWICKEVSASGYRYSGGPMSALDESGPSRYKDNRFTVWRTIPYEEAVGKLTTLEGDALDQYVLEVLASDLWGLRSLGWYFPDIEDVFFVQQDRLLTGLRKACANPDVRDSAQTFLEFLGKLDGSHAQQLLKDERRSTPKVEVSARRLNDAVEKAAEAYQLVGQQEDVEIIIDRTVLTGSCDMALIRCHSHHGGIACQGFKLRFERVDGKWVLKAFVFEWIT
jgi:hypothetical protein